MDSEQIIAEFKQAFKVPVDAVREAEQRREEMIPLLSDIIADAAKAPLEEVTDQEGLVFMAFHLLGSWQATSAYHAVADLLGSDSEKVEWLLGDAVTITSHRVMFNLFDGDLAPLKRLIGKIPLSTFMSGAGCSTCLACSCSGESWSGMNWWFICATCMAGWKAIRKGWSAAGWAELVAQVGLRELTDLVDESFQAKKIEPMFISRTDFYRILKDAEAGQVMQGIPREFEPFDDLVEELGDWTIRDDWDKETEIGLDVREETAAGGWGTEEVLSAIRWAVAQTVSNLCRHVGRNDPCPCGSGKKFKRCCGK